jgi:hypothetical protein
MVIIISIILNLMLGAPANQTTDTTSTDKPEQTITAMGGGSAWTNND